MKKLFLLRMLIIAHCSIHACRLEAQIFTRLHSFTGSDGTNPQGDLILSSDILYGTTYGGGSSGNGSVFAMNKDGSGFTNLYSFTALLNSTNSDGANPRAGLILSGNTLYGTAVNGGSSGFGTLFALKTNGTGFTTLHTFAVISEGINPFSKLVSSENNLYGTTRYGGLSGSGTVFALNTNGTGFTNLYRFSASQNGTNSEGAYPIAGLVLSGDTLYGTTSQRGPGNSGTVFALKTDGTGFTNLHNFAEIFDNSFPFSPTNSDGAIVYPDLILSGSNILYGTASQGGAWGNGTIFALSTDGTGFTNLHIFTPNDVQSAGPNSDGALPISGLILFGNTLYGTASLGGGSGRGTILPCILMVRVLLILIASRRFQTPPTATEPIQKPV